MTIQLAQNIRTFRKQRALTQEQLAEVLGVTVGAVYKWEAGLSLPELTMLMELAAFFDTSVDVLLGYELQDNRLEATVERLKNFRIQKNREGLGEAEKALKKYPNSFEIAYQAAAIYQCFGTESGEKQLLHRAMELLRDCRLKVYEVAEQVGYRDIAYFSATFKKLVGMSPSEYQDVSH